MKTLLYFSLLSWSLVSFAQVSRPELDKQVKNFVTKMNQQFGLKVDVAVSEECGFRASERDNEEGDIIKGDYVIEYCDSDINYFSKLPASTDAVGELLTIIGHEYAHFLLDYDVGEEVSEDVGDLQVEVAKIILEQIKSRPEILETLRTIIASWEEDEEEEYEENESISEDQLLMEAIDFVLMLGMHENVDTLSAKLLELAGIQGRPGVLRYMPDLYNDNSEVMQNMVNARIPELETSVKEGLSDWSNFVCANAGRSHSDFNPAFKMVMSRGGFNKVLEAASRECSQPEMVENFYKLLVKYYPQ